MQTAERISSHDNSDNVIYQRHLIAYHSAKEMIGGKVLEIGSGEGYGFQLLAPLCEKYTSVDKFPPRYDISEYSNADFIKMTIPPLQFEDNSFDFIVTFQVIEHIEDDDAFISEMARVLKPGGKAIITTPNIKMSLTRNPWHVREYTFQELTKKLKQSFANVNMQGVYGDEAIMEYYQANKKGVERITRFDIFNLQYRLPRRLLQIPYDFLNRVNRRKLLNDNDSAVSAIKWQDYSIKEATDTCFDLFAIAEK